MTSPTVEEIIIATKPEGIDETTDKVEGLEDSVEGSADSMDDQASAMSAFSKRFQGAMSAVVAGLAISSGFLLSRVPVLGETFEGLVSVIDSLVWHMDSALRPIMSPVADALFDLSDKIFDLEGDMASLVGIGGSMATVFGLLLFAIGPVGAAIAGLAVGTALLMDKFDLLEPVLDGIIDLGGALLDVVIGATQGTDEFFEALGELKDVIIDLVGNALEWFIDVAKELGSTIVETVEDTDWFALGEDMMQFIIDGISFTLGALGDAATTVADKLWDILKETDWIQLGKDIVGLLIDGLKAVLFLLAGAASVLGSEIWDALEDIDWVELGKDIVRGIASGLKDAVSIVGDAASDVASEVRSYLPGSDAEQGALRDFTQIPQTMAETLSTVPDQPALRNAPDRLAQQIDPRNGRTASHSTPTETTHVMEMDGRVVGRTVGTRQRDITASRNIDG